MALQPPPGRYPPGMAETLRVACVQLNASEVKADNLEKAEKLVAKAAATGADVVVLPEKWNAWGGPEVIRAAGESIEEGETFAGHECAGRARHGITLVGGSVTEARDGREKLSNTSPVFDPDGELVAVYRKIHLFDVEVGGQVYRESETEEPGDEVVLCDAEAWRLGLTICYDLRFPELYRILALEGAESCPVPAAFTLFTGKDHWELLVRARAVENQLYVVAANQWGAHAPGKASYGRSMIVDPWGVRTRRRTGRGHRHRCRDRPGRLRAGAVDAPGAREPAACRISLACRRMSDRLRAVVFDVDFTIGKPGPLLGAGRLPLRRRCAAGSSSTRPGTTPRARPQSTTSSTTRSSTTTRWSGSASPKTSSAGWAARAPRSARSRSRSSAPGSSRRTSSSTRTFRPCSVSSGATAS